MNIHDLFTMGGYGWYVWSAFSITFFVLGFNLFLFAYEKKQIKKNLRHQQKICK
ncbi:MAG TPA: heme exporter protein CcmD [Gammaproteobacteria bacterium]|nr:heme exporter protein CcmD [Gammaproteobacteria bacterium]